MNKILLIFMALLLGSGCLSSYNHSRVQNNITKSRIYQSGNPMAIRMVEAGVSPRQAVQISAAQTDHDGFQAMISVNVFESGNWFSTFREAPLSTIGSLAVDLGVTYAAGRYLDKNGFNISYSGSNKGRTYIYVYGDGNEVVYREGNDGAISEE